MIRQTYTRSARVRSWTPSISACMDMCSGFWCAELSTERFFHPVDAHQSLGEEEFGKVFREVEEGVEIV